MKNQQWVWQRLYKHFGSPVVCAAYAETPDHYNLHTSDEHMAADKCVWLCPKPNKVLIHWSADEMPTAFFTKKIGV